MVKQVEGILIEAYRMNHNDLPPWNKIGGSTDGQRAATQGNYEIVRCFSVNFNLPLVSRYTLRELAANATYEWYENFMHSVRIVMLSWGEFAKNL